MNKIDRPENAEKATLVAYLTAVKDKDQNQKKCHSYCTLFSTLGFFLLVVVYCLNDTSLILNYWLDGLCVISGILIGGSLIINKWTAQSALILNYIDIDAIKSRIEEISNLPEPDKPTGDEWK